MSRPSSPLRYWLRVLLLGALLGVLLYAVHLLWGTLP